MKVSEIAALLDAKLITGEEMMDLDIHSACGSDLMSDVLAFVKDQGMLLTGLVNSHVIRTAEMMDIRVIAFIRGKQPDEEVARLAEEKEMVILCTQLPMYVACGRLYEAGLSGGGATAR